MSRLLVHTDTVVSALQAALRTMFLMWMETRCRVVSGFFFAVHLVGSETFVFVVRKNIDKQLRTLDRNINLQFCSKNIIEFAKN